MVSSGALSGKGKPHTTLKRASNPVTTLPFEKNETPAPTVLSRSSLAL
jgi:hypothetical protein